MAQKTYLLDHLKKNPLHTSWLQNQHSTAYALSGKQEKNLCTLKESQREGETFLLWSNRGKKPDL